MHIVLHEPEIPSNTGNIIRLCANTGFTLHLIKPLGFKLESRYLLRAGLDHHDLVQIKIHQTLNECLNTSEANDIFAFTSKANQYLYKTEFSEGPWLIFGKETKGLPISFLDSLDESKKIKIPVRPKSRCLNLSNAVAIAAYEVIRQFKFNLF